MEICWKQKELGLSWKELGISLKELGISRKELGLSWKELGIPGKSGGFSGKSKSGDSLQACDKSSLYKGQEMGNPCKMQDV